MFRTKRARSVIYSILLATLGASFASMGHESIKVSIKNSSNYGFEIVKESGGKADEVVLIATGPMTDKYGCEFRGVGTATLDAQDAQVSICVSHARQINSFPKVIFSPNTKKGYQQIAWFNYECKKEAYRYEITI